MFLNIFICISYCYFFVFVYFVLFMNCLALPCLTRLPRHELKQFRIALPKDRNYSYMRALSPV